MKSLNKIPASAMQFAILVSVIVAVLLGSFLTLTYTHTFFGMQSKHVIRSIEAAHNGLLFALQSENSTIDSISLESELPTTLIKRKFWGGFQLLESEGSVKAKNFKKKALAGSVIPKKNTSLYLSDKSIPLALVGNTSIEGTAYISEKGVKPGVISGHYFNGTQLIDGEIKYSSGRLPELLPNWKRYAENMLNFIPSGKDDVIPILEENKNSFYDPTHIIFSRAPLKLSESFVGNILIKSESSITISSYAELNDVAIIAPFVIIEKGFHGNAHIIARDSIKLEEDVKLYYPSSIVVMKNWNSKIEKNGKEQPPIVISDSSYVGGMLMYIDDRSKSNTERSKVYIDILPKATVEGQIYCQGNVQLSGTVIGSVFTEKCITKAFGSVYINHIYNGKILAKDLHPRFVGLPFKDSNGGIAAWLY